MMLTFHEAGALLGVSASTIRRRVGINWNDKVAVSEYNRQYRLTNAERLKARKQARAKEIAATRRAYNESHREQARVSEKIRYASKPDVRARKNASARKYFALNREKIRQHYRAWAKTDEGRSQRRSHASKRRAVQLQAVVTWTEHEQIKAIYRESTEWSRLTGTPHHVDHIVPLQSRFVCGLHVVSNLAIVPGRENASKQNRFWPDMP